MRYDRTIEGARRVLKHIFTLAPTNVQIQHEIRVEGKSLEDTAAGSVHREEVERIIAKHRAELAELKTEMAKLMVQNAAFRRELEAEKAQARQHLIRWEKEKSELKNGLVEVRRDRTRLEAEVAIQRKDHEQLRQDHEREWSSRIDSRARAHDVASHDQLDQEKTRWGSEGRSREERRLEGQRKIRAMEMQMGSPPPPYETEQYGKLCLRSQIASPGPDMMLAQGVTAPGPINSTFQFAYSDMYPPYLRSSQLKNLLALPTIFDFSALLETTVMLFVHEDSLPSIFLDMAPDSATTHTMQDLVNRNHVLHAESHQDRYNNQIPLFRQGMYFNKNIGLRDDWYTDAVFGQQQFTGTNPTTITVAPRRWIDEFTSASDIQRRADIAELLTKDPENIFMQDYSDFRSALGVSPSAELTCDGRYGCSSVALFHLEPEGTLHPLAITLDYKGSMEESVTIFNRRITSSTSGDESSDWPWRYAKMCTQVSDWLRHEVGIHLVNTHLVEEVIIVAAKRAFDPRHVVLQLLEPHWNSTLPLNAGARDTLLPKIIIPMTGHTAEQVYKFVKTSYSKFNWTGLYIPNDLRRRGFPPELLAEPKYHNYGYARNITHMWEILRKFVRTALVEIYVGGDAQVANDPSIMTFCQEVRSYAGGQLTSFPQIQTLDELIDFVTMSIHTASPQQTAVNYLQQYYQTFIPNKPSTLYTPLPQSLGQLEAYEEKDILLALPIHRPSDWLLMAHVPYLLSFEVPDDGTILYYAATTSDSGSTLLIIRTAARVLRDDLVDFIYTVSEHSEELDDQQTPYLVLDPSKTAISILI